MKSKKLISAILAAASIAGGVVGAQAQTIEGLENKVDTYTSRVQQAETKIQDLQTKVDALDTTGIANNKAGIEANKNAIATQGKQISKLQKDTDKQHWQIDALEKKTGVNTPLINGAGNLSAGVNENTRKIDAEATARENAVNGLQSQVTTQGAQISQLQKDMAQDAMDRAAEMDKLTTKVNQKADKADVEANKNDIASNAAAIQTETQKREEAVKGLQDKLTVVNGQIENEKTTRENADKAEAKAREEADTKLQNNIDNKAAARFAGDNALNSRINQVESDATKGIAKASALAALHPLDYDPDNKFDIAAAGGFYKGENAFALGAFYRPNRNVMLSMGTTLTGGDNAYNVGLTFKIGKSGKHTEAGLTTADLYAMIGAMQDKMDQQQKKIEELEAKQAK